MKTALLGLLALSTLVSGWMVSDGLKHFRTQDRTVSVKGLAEREVKADLAFWHIPFSVSDESMAEAKKKLERDAAVIRAFLRKHDVDSLTIRNSRIMVSEELIRRNYNAPVEGKRYTLTSGIKVRTHDVDVVEKAARHLGDLVGQGVLLGYGGAPQYSFSGLNDIKPDMIAQATRNAREAANEFARDSGAKVGKIRRAHQGYFSILARDHISDMSEREQIYKRIRVVSHFDFALK